MIRNTRAVISTFLLIGLTSIDAQAAPVKGKVKGTNPSQYSILAIKKNGQSAVKPLSNNGNFSLNVSKGMTLHLVDSNSRYFGPIVASKGSKGYASLSGKKGSLGNITVKASFATVPYGKVQNLMNKKPVVNFSKTTGTSGAGKFGLVSLTSQAVGASSVVHAAESDAFPGEDTDFDGLPNVLDIDDDGDLVLDVSDADTGSTPEYRADLTSTLRTTLPTTVNKNIPGTTDSTIDSALSDGMILGFNFRSNSTTNQLTAVNVDCGSLSYCAEGTTSATIRSDNLSQLENTPWTAYDPDNDGLPNLEINSTTYAYVGVKPHANRSSIKPGDVLNFIATGSTSSVTIPVMIPFYFSTGPALVQYSAGNVSGSISYPVTDGGVGTTVGNPIVLGSGAMTMTFFKPQRPPVEGAETTDVDNGNLFYGLYLSPSGSTGSPLLCKPSEYSDASSGLEKNSNSDTETINALFDTSADAAASSEHTISFTIDLATCLSRQGVSTSGATVYIDLNATTRSGDQTSQSFYVRLP